MIIDSSDGCGIEVPRAVGEFAVEERQRLLDRIESQAIMIEQLSGLADERAREIERLGKYKRFESAYHEADAELAALKAQQPIGVVLPERRGSEFWPITEAEHAHNAALDEVARLNSSTGIAGEPGEHVPDAVFQDEFMVWWEKHGQFCRAGGVDYERTFAFQAWRHLYPILMQARAALTANSGCKLNTGVRVSGVDPRKASEGIEIDWDSGNGITISKALEAVICEIAAMANKHNDNDWFEEAEQIARDALSTALYNPTLLRDVLVELGVLTASAPNHSEQVRDVAPVRRELLERVTVPMLDTPEYLFDHRDGLDEIRQLLDDREGVK